MSDENWYVVIDGRPEGPYSTDRVHELQLALRINGNTLVARPGSKKWLPLNEWPELADLQSSQPFAAISEKPAPNPGEIPVRTTSSAGEPSDHSARAYAEIGLFEWLIDTKFERFVTPRAVRILWVAIVIGGAFSTIVAILAGLAAAKDHPAAVVFIPLAIGGILVALLAARMWLELIIIRFYEGQSAFRGRNRRNG